MSSPTRPASVVPPDVDEAIAADVDAAALVPPSSTCDDEASGVVGSDAVADLPLNIHVTEEATARPKERGALARAVTVRVASRPVAATARMLALPAACARRADIKRRVSARRVSYGTMPSKSRKAISWASRRIFNTT